MVRDDYVLYPNGDLELRDSSFSAYLNHSLSNCSNFVYDYNYYSNTAKGIWWWDDTNKRLVVVFEFDSRGRSNSRFRNFEILEKNDSKIILSYTDAWNFFYIIDWRKLP